MIAGNGAINDGITVVVCWLCCCCCGHIWPVVKLSGDASLGDDIAVGGSEDVVAIAPPAPAPPVDAAPDMANIIVFCCGYIAKLPSLSCCCGGSIKLE